MKSHATLKALALGRPEVQHAYDALSGRYADVRTEEALKRLQEQSIGLAEAARLSGVSASKMMDICAERRISLAGYAAEELMGEIEQFEEKKEQPNSI